MFRHNKRNYVDQLCQICHSVTGRRQSAYKNLIYISRKNILAENENIQLHGLKLR